MAVIEVKTIAFNDKEITMKIEFFIQKNRPNKTLSIKVYKEIIDRLQKELNLNDIEFNIESKDLQNLQKRNISIDSDSLITQLYKVVKDEYLKEDGKIENALLKRAIELFNERKNDDAKKILDKIKVQDLSIFEFNEYQFLKFKLKEEKTIKDFETLKDIFKDNPTKLKELYFNYIKYLEDSRDEKIPYKLIEEFENIFDLDELSKEEEAFYYYLNGRNYYLRGEFLLAISNLKEAFLLTKDEKILSNIYNTSANIFTDNLFFTEALSLANKALYYRDLLKLPSIYDSYSLIGGIYLKNSQYKKAYKYYQKANEGLENSRIYNYLAKSTIMLGYSNKALEYIQKAKSFNNDKKGFTKLIELFYLYKIENYNKSNDFFIENFVNPDNNKDYDKFVLAWAYTIKALISFKRKEYNEGVIQLTKAINYFLKDKYILESFYIHLYPFAYNLPQKELDKFLSLIEDFYIKEKFNEYIFKHKTLSDKYSNIFQIEQGKNNLEEFFEKTKNISPKAYNPSTLKNILDNYNFI